VYENIYGTAQTYVYIPSTGHTIGIDSSVLPEISASYAL
jgi:hypothetical protein